MTSLELKLNYKSANYDLILDLKYCSVNLVFRDLFPDNFTKPGNVSLNHFPLAGESSLQRNLKSK
jgi:hypothetical protein